MKKSKGGTGPIVTKGTKAKNISKYEKPQVRRYPDDQEATHPRQGHQARVHAAQIRAYLMVKKKASAKKKTARKKKDTAISPKTSAKPVVTKYGFILHPGYYG